MPIGWEDFTRPTRGSFVPSPSKPVSTNPEAKDVEQETLLCVAKTIHEF
jgi:hypothetical protein